MARRTMRRRPRKRVVPRGVRAGVAAGQAVKRKKIKPSTRIRKRVLAKPRTRIPIKPSKVVSKPVRAGRKVKPTRLRKATKGALLGTVGKRRRRRALPSGVKQARAGMAGRRASASKRGLAAGVLGGRSKRPKRRTRRRRTTRRKK